MLSNCKDTLGSKWIGTSQMFLQPPLKSFSLRDVWVWLSAAAVATMTASAATPTSNQRSCLLVIFFLLFFCCCFCFKRTNWNLPQQQGGNIWIFEASGCCDKSLVSLDGVSTLSKQNQLNIHFLWWLEVVSVLVFSFLFFSCFVFCLPGLSLKCLPSVAGRIVHQCDKKRVISCVFVSAYCRLIWPKPLTSSCTSVVPPCLRPSWVWWCVSGSVQQMQEKKEKKGPSVWIWHMQVFFFLFLFSHTKQPYEAEWSHSQSSDVS